MVPRACPGLTGCTPLQAATGDASFELDAALTLLQLMQPQEVEKHAATLVSPLVLTMCASTHSTVALLPKLQLQVNPTHQPLTCALCVSTGSAPSDLHS